MKTSFDADTDKKHELKLESKILYALWNRGVARGGSEAQLEVRTVFVGQGADIEITGKSSRGKAPGKIKGKVLNNRFTGRLPVPEDVDPQAVVWFEAKLPKHGLKIESNKIPAAPPIVLKSMQWDREEARRGDVVRIQAEFGGVKGHEEAVVRILEYAASGTHHPVASISTQLQEGKLDVEWEYQFFEPTVEIPVEKELEEFGEHYQPPEYFFEVMIDGSRFGMSQESGLLEFKDWVELRFTDSFGQPLVNAAYSILLADGSERTGSLDENGIVSEEDLPPGRFQVAIESASNGPAAQEA